LKYTIKRQISSGSFGTIYEILNEEVNKIYALKELTNIDIVSKERFEREVKILTIALASNMKIQIEKLSRSRETMAYQIMCHPLM
jgi:serine/threonine protein kinase